MSALREAIEELATCLETGLWLTSDGGVVHSHQDERVARDLRALLAAHPEPESETRLTEHFIAENWAGDVWLWRTDGQNDDYPKPVLAKRHVTDPELWEFLALHVGPWVEVDA